MHTRLILSVFVLALLIGDGSASAGVDNPLKWDGVHVVHRCPKLANPIECGHWSASHDSHGGRSHRHVRYVHVSHRMRCTLLRDRYYFHHWQGKPSELRGYTGCALYRKDAAYHSALYRVGLHSPSEQEAFESLMSVIGHLRQDFLTS